MIASLLKPANTAEHTTPSKDVSSEVFMPKDTIDQPFDVVLVVEDGNEFRAHRQVLSEASPFFEKLLNSDMKESREGIVRLEMFSESVMGNTLEFIYTSNVQILTEDNARDLIVIADFLFLENLKTLAEGVLLQKLNASNCISIFYFSERYQSHELVYKAKKIILANFTTLFAGDRKEGLNMSSKQVQMWISSDEINVAAEEDVFTIILTWIDHDNSKRKKYFAELFREVRLVYVSLDFLCSNIATNDLVNDNEDCLALVEKAMRLIESGNYHNLPVAPRKWLDVPVIVACSQLKGRPIQCYFLREDRWYDLGKMPSDFFHSYLAPCHGKIYALQTASPNRECRMVSFSPYTNNWTLLPCIEDRDVKQIFVANENEMYALVTEPYKYHGMRSSMRRPLDKEIEFCGKEKHISFITKYKPESNSWEDISSFDHMNLRENVCIVANDSSIYFIGGEEKSGTDFKFLTDVERYDLRKNQWDKVADIQIARSWATGAAANGKIVIAGGVYDMGRSATGLRCEVFNETTNEWHFISNFGIHPQFTPKLLSVDDRLFVVATEPQESVLYQRKVECYDPDNDEWHQNTCIPLTKVDQVITFCSMRIFKGFLDTRETASLSVHSSCNLSSSRLHAKNRKQASMNERRQRKCFIL
ncbi:hypothetical protein ACROYT_G038603 [Oculina patagonica]